MAISGTYEKFLTKKNVPTAVARGMIRGMAVSVSGAEELARCQEKITTIKLASSIPPFRENAAFSVYAI